MKAASKFRAGAIAAVAIAAVVATSVLPASAGQFDFRKAVPGSGKGITIGLIGLDDAIGFGKDVHDSIAREAKAAGATLVFCDSKLNAATALNCAKTFKLKKVQGYLNFQPVSTAAAAVCKAGPQVPVISIDIEQDPCQTAFMGADNSYAGQVSGIALGKYFKDKFNCSFDAFISLEDYGVGLVNEARMGGYRSGFESICGAGSIGDKLIKIDAGRLEPALAKMKDALTTLPNAHHVVVVAINDEGIQGAFSAAKAVGRAGDIYAAGQGASASAWCDIKNTPNWIADTAYFPERYGEIGVPYLLDLIKGKKVPFQLKIKHVAINAGNLFTVFPAAKAKCA
jgi:ribose transport system substrate-binding protein